MVEVVLVPAAESPRHLVEIRNGTQTLMKSTIRWESVVCELIVPVYIMHKQEGRQYKGNNNSIAEAIESKRALSVSNPEISLEVCKQMSNLGKSCNPQFENLVVGV